jgi:hypothetical protein
VEDIFRRAQSGDHPAARRYDDPRIRQLVTACAELQRASGIGAFYLACRTVGGLLGIDHQDAAEWLGGLVGDGVLELVEKHRGRRAARYRFVAIERDAATGEIEL